MIKELFWHFGFWRFCSGFPNTRKETELRPETVFLAIGHKAAGRVNGELARLPGNPGRLFAPF